MAIRNEEGSTERDSARQELREIESEMKNLKREVEVRDIAMEAFGQRIAAEIAILREKVEGKVGEMRGNLRELGEEIEREVQTKETKWRNFATQITGSELPSDSQISDLSATFHTQQGQIHALQSSRELLESEFQASFQSITSLIDSSLDAANQPMSLLCREVEVLEKRTEKELERLETAWETRSREIDDLAERLMKQCYDQANELG